MNCIWCITWHELAQESKGDTLRRNLHPDRTQYLFPVAENDGSVWSVCSVSQWLHFYSCDISTTCLIELLHTDNVEVESPSQTHICSAAYSSWDILLVCRMTSIECLPDDIILKILELLPPEKRVQLALVCKHWHSVCLRSWRTMTFDNMNSNELGPILKWLKTVSPNSSQTLRTLRIEITHRNLYGPHLIWWPGDVPLLDLSCLIFWLPRVFGHASSHWTPIWLLCHFLSCLALRWKIISHSESGPKCCLSESSRQDSYNSNMSHA